MGFLRYSTPSNVPPVVTAFAGNPNVTITSIDTSGGIVTSRDADAFTAQAPYPIHCSASAITATGTGTIRPFEDLEFNWTVTGPEAGDTFVRPTDGATVNSFTDQVSPEAAFFLRTPGTYTITLVCRGKNGAGYTTASVSKDVTFVAFAAATTYYLDSTIATGGVGTSPATAFKTTAALNAAISTNGSFATYTNLSVQIKNGSDFTGQTGLRFNGFGYNKYTGVRVNTYGTGAKPIFDDPVGSALNLTTNLSSSNDCPMYDIIFQGLSFKKTTGTASNLISVAASGASLGYRPIENLYFDTCDMRMDNDTASGYVQIVQFEPGSKDANVFKKFGFWKCTITNPAVVSHIASGISGSATQWWFVYGTAISGGGTGNYDHHIYPNVRFHELYKWNSFGIPGVASNRGYCLDLNFDADAFTPGQVTTVRWHVVSENQCTGTQNAVDAGNRGNNYPGDGTVQFTEMVVERNAMFGHVAGNFIMQVPCAQGITIRDNRTWKNDSATPFFVPDYPGQVAGQGVGDLLSSRVYRNRVHTSPTAPAGQGPVIRMAQTAPRYQQPQQWTDNKLADYRSSANILNFVFADFTTNGSTIDRNQLWAPHATSGFLVQDGASSKTWVDYRNAGWDPNGSNTDPGWAETVTQWSDLN